MTDESPSSVAERETITEVIAPRDAAYIEIVEETDVFPWQYVDEHGNVFATKFWLRLLPETLDKKWRKELTTVDRRKGGRHEVLNWEAYSQRALQYCITKWDGLRRKGTGQELPCELRYILLLPERVKAEIIRLCVGKEAALDESPEDAKNG